MTNQTPKPEPAARDTTFDGVKPERVWVRIGNCEMPGRFRVVLEINGIDKVIYDSIDECDGNISHHTNLSWLFEPAEPMGECIACKYSGNGIDGEREYAAYGCPACTCKPAQDVADKGDVRVTLWWANGHNIFSALEGSGKTPDCEPYVELSDYNKLKRKFKHVVQERDKARAQAEKYREALERISADKNTEWTGVIARGALK